jgi:hypothetical protein
VLDSAPNALAVSGIVKLDLFGVVMFDGEFGFEKSTTQVTLSNDEIVAVDVMSMTAFNVNAFAGFNGNSPDRIGFELTDVDFALVFMNDQADTKRKWTSLSASIGSAGFVGSDEFFVGGTNFKMALNMESYDGVVVDYKKRNYSAPQK